MCMLSGNNDENQLKTDNGICKLASNWLYNKAKSQLDAKIQ